MASGAARNNFCVQRATASSSSAAGTTSLTSPQSRAVPASTLSPESSRPMARFMPIWRGRRCMPPA
jgi:hypothetical protein